MSRRSLLLLAVAGLAAALALMQGCTSTRTRPIVDDAGRPVPGSIALLEKIVLGGVDQWILIRGADRTKPLLLKLHGGPGQAEMATAPFNRRLEQDFVVVEWDQRGAGKSSHASVDLHVDRFVEDTRELSQHLLARFGQRQLLLVGHSWGSVIGLLAVQQYPRLYSAFISTGQMVSMAEGGRIAHAALTARAAERGEREALADLARLGPPPYLGERRHDQQKAWLQALQNAGGFWHAAEPRFEPVRWMLAAPEYAWPEKLAFTQAAERSFEALLPELAAVDLRARVPEVAVPVHFVVGRHDLMAPSTLARQYFEQLRAPMKRWHEVDDAAHFPQWEQAASLHEIAREAGSGGR